MPSPFRVLAPMVVALVLLAAGGCSDGSEPDQPAASGSTSSPGASPADALVQRGLTQLEKGDAEAAAVTFDNALALDPGNVYALYNLGFIHQDRGEDGKAASYYQQTIDQDPTFTQALFNLGILTEPDDLGAAVDLYRRAVAADDTFAAAWMRLGFALQHLGQDDEAEEALGKGVALDPSMADVEAPSYDH